jgi:hypothetical protein
MEHLAAHEGIAQLIAESLQRVKVGSRPPVRTVDPMHGFSNDPAYPLLNASSEQPLVPAKITGCDANGVFHLYAAEIRR